MSNSKISALTSATTPLAGTETLPIVQSSATKQVAVSDLTAGRAVVVGSLGVGVTPVTAIQVGVSGTSTGTQETVLLARYSSDTAQFRWLWNYSGTGYLGIGTSGTSMIFGRATGTSGAVGATLMTIATGGDITVNAGNLVQGTAAKGINFTANSAAAGKTSQLLNWYEEGTWTPTSYDITYATATGTYTRIGREVFVHFTITLPTTSDANNITINGFPFTVSNTNDMRSGCIGYTNYGTACMPTAVINAARGNILKFDGTAVTNVSASGKTFSGVFIYNV